MKTRHLPAPLTFILAVAFLFAAPTARSDFRPPSVPLVTCNPFLSVWSGADHLTDVNTKHWTGRDHPLVSLIRVDGASYRIMGAQPAAVSPMTQTSLRTFPTRSIYEFEQAGVHVSLSFLQPLLPDDLDVFSWPLAYITWSVRSVDGAEHKVEIYDSTSSLLSVNNPEEPVEWSRQAAGDLTLLRVGTVEQPVLGSCGDSHRINWGYACIAARKGEAKSAIGENTALVQSFVSTGTLPSKEDARSPRAAKDAEPVLAFAFDLGKVGKEPVQRQVAVAYDEIFAIKYFGKKLLPYWARNGAKMSELLQTAFRKYPKLLPRCEAFDTELLADLTKMGGEKYAAITALAYRECIAGNGLAADANKQPLLFCKENTSNGNMATVDVFFPMDPVWILLSPSLAKASLVHVLMYSATPRWKFPNAPHDLGEYPIVFGRDDGGEGMPVEESGNMLLLCDAIAHADGNADFVSPWWPQLTQWAAYLEKYGLDPEKQLCTDDFMGHLAHNANLGIKAILGLAAYGDLCRMRGDEANAKKYSDLAKGYAAHWMQVADDGDHYRLAFDKPGTWSLKYNLVWDRLLGLNIFPPSVAQKEIAHYKRVMQPYGVPLDSRTKGTKTDWLFWAATLAENQVDFEAIIDPVYHYFNETTVRNPLADFYRTDTVKSSGMHARPVVGGFFIKMLSDRELWKKWASRDKLKPANWAAVPTQPKFETIIPMEQAWCYTVETPAEEWMNPMFNDTAWGKGQGGFGFSTPSFTPHTEWKSKDIWLRREITVPDGTHSDIQFLTYFNAGIDIYVNGIHAAGDQTRTKNYALMELSPHARALIKPGAKVVIAVHGSGRQGAQGIDVGLVDVLELKESPSEKKENTK